MSVSGRKKQIQGLQRGSAGSGFTLIELSFVLIISGLLTAILFDALHYKTAQDLRQVTLDNLAVAQSAITEFVGNQGRYPCPAVLNLPQTDPNYGKENCAGAINVAGPNGNVLIGAIPYADMAPDLQYTTMPASQTVDGWGRKMEYAVSQTLTTTATFDPNKGAIDVQDENGLSVLQSPNSAHMVLVSFGDDGRGAYMPSGQQVEPCGNSISSNPPPNPPPVTTAQNELQNCDNNNNVFLSGLRNVSEWSYNDDIVKFMTIQVGSLWKITGVTASNLYQVANTNPGNVGIGTDTPSQPLEVSGVFAAAAIKAKNICDPGDVNCMPPQVIAGSGMGCTGTNQGIQSIGLNTANCATVFTPHTVSCPPGQVINGISNLGNVTCMAP